jgi:hypothetical protein
VIDRLASAHFLTSGRLHKISDFVLDGVSLGFVRRSLRGRFARGAVRVRPATNTQSTPDEKSLVHAGKNMPEPGIPAELVATTDLRVTPPPLTPPYEGGE